MDLEIQPLTTLSDFHDLSTMQFDAFPTNDLFHSLLYPSGRDPSQLLHDAETEQRRSLSEPLRKYVKVTDLSTGESTAFATYSVFSHGDASLSFTDVESQVNCSAYQAAKLKMRNLRHRHIGSKPHACKFLLPSQNAIPRF